jgi:hypothetical protein
MVLVLAAANSSVVPPLSTENERMDVAATIRQGTRGHDPARLHQREVRIGIEIQDGMDHRRGEGSRRLLLLCGRERIGAGVVVVDQDETGSRRHLRECRREKKRNQDRARFLRFCRISSESCLPHPHSMVTLIFLTF